MKTRFFLCVLFLYVAHSASAQDDSLMLDRYYAGLLYVGSYDRHLALQDDLSVRVGVQASTRALSGLTVVRMAYADPGTSVAHFWMEQGDFSFGYMPRPISVIKPNPVSGDAHFIPGAFEVLPGAATGITYVCWRDTAGGRDVLGFDAPETVTTASELTVGVYRSAVSRGIEVDAGLTLATGETKLRFAWLVNEKEIGLAAMMERKDAWKVLLFRSDSSVTSAFLQINGPDGFNPFISLIFREHGASQHELGVCKEFHTETGVGKMTTLIGLGYRYPQKLGRVYLQVYL